MAYNSCINDEKVINMWNEFNDFELAQLAGQYGLEDSLVFSGDLSLANRAEVESLLTLAEHDMAFGE
jgi:hypothetical protein